jgi:hypothetical protein
VVNPPSPCRLRQTSASYAGSFGAQGFAYLLPLPCVLGVLCGDDPSQAEACFAKLRCAGIDGMSTRPRERGFREEQTSYRVRHESSLNKRRVDNDNEKESSQQARTD